MDAAQRNHNLTILALKKIEENKKISWMMLMNPYQESDPNYYRSSMMMMRVWTSAGMQSKTLMNLLPLKGNDWLYHPVLSIFQPPPLILCYSGCCWGRADDGTGDISPHRRQNKKSGYSIWIRGGRWLNRWNKKQDNRLKNVTVN